MHLGTLVSGPSLAGTDNLSVGCKSGSCYGAAPGADATLQQLQDLLNSYARALKLTPLKADYVNGVRVALIGEQTVKVAKQVASYMTTTFKTADVAVLGALAADAKTLATTAPMTISILSQYVGKLGLTPAPLPSSPPMTTTPPRLPPSTSMPLPALPTGPRRWPWFLAGGLLIAGVGTAAYIHYAKS